MKNVGLIMLVIFIVVMCIWGLSLWGAFGLAAHEGVVAFVAVLILGIAMFVTGTNPPNPS
jgi:hypothetical protein